MLSTAFLAYTFGLRHAVDPDHIAAIDNVTRKLMQEKKQPLAAGLYFSLGHSTIVFIATILISLLTKKFVQNYIHQWQMFGGFFCTLVSSVFLLLIGFINLSLFLSTYKVLKEIKQGKIYEPQYVENLLQNRGFLSSRFKRIFKMITHSWQMYLLGFLFGLGFDTATEIALLGIAATQTLDGFGLSSVLIFPTLFMAGMTLIDTLDCLLMFGAYGWAFLNPIRKLYYNLSIMFVSVSVAFIIGLLESLNLLVTKVEIHGQLGSLIRLMSSQSGSWGYYIIFIFIISLVISLIYSKTKSQVQAKRDQVIDSLDPI